MSGAMPRASHGIPLLEVGTHLLLKPFGPEILLEAITIMLNVERAAVPSQATAAPAFPR